MWFFTCLNAYFLGGTGGPGVAKPAARAVPNMPPQMPGKIVG
jgi:hypothetical protein